MVFVGPVLCCGGGAVPSRYVIRGARPPNATPRGGAIVLNRSVEADLYVSGYGEVVRVADRASSRARSPPGGSAGRTRPPPRDIVARTLPS